MISPDTRSEQTKQLFAHYDSTLNEWSSKFYPYITQADYWDFCGYLISVTEHHLKLNPSLFNNDYSHDRIISLCKEFELNHIKDATTRSTMLWRLLSSEFLKDIIHAFDEVAKNIDHLQSDRILYYFDSGHDVNLIPILRALGTDYPNHIPFATSLFFELHEDDINSELFVKVFLDDLELDINVQDQLDSQDLSEEMEIESLVTEGQENQSLDEPD